MNKRQQWLELLESGAKDAEIGSIMSSKLFSRRDVSSLIKLDSRSFSINKIYLDPGRNSRGDTGFFACYNWLFGSHEGHFEATERALVKLDCELDDHVKVAICLATRLPDFLYFDSPEFHGMCRHDANYYPASGSSVFTDLFKTILQNLNENLDCLMNDEKDYRRVQILFDLGLYFHLIQDLAVHRGMTSPEHAWLDALDRSPDADMSLFEFAVELSEIYLRKQLLKKLRKNAKHLNALPEITWGEFETVRNLKHLATAFAEYKRNVIPEEKKEYISRWFNIDSRSAGSKVSPEITRILPFS